MPGPNGPCKNCMRKQEYINQGIECCHSVCEEYKKFDAMNKLVRQKRREATILNTLKKDSFQQKPSTTSARKNHRKKI